MSKQQTMTVEAIQEECIVSRFILRGNNAGTEKVIEDYAALMKSKDFTITPVIVGTYTVTEEDVDVEKGELVKREVDKRLLIDGYMRVMAASIAKIATLPVELVKYDDENAALADMLKRNMGRGRDVSPGERNKRVELLAKRGVKRKDIAGMVNLTPASITRILQGKQGEANNGKQNQGKSFEGRAARGSKQAEAAQPQQLNLFAWLEQVPTVIAEEAQIMLTTSTIEDLDVLDKAIDALKGLQKDLVKALHVGSQRKKAA